MKEILDQEKFYFDKAQQNSSRQSFEEIVKIIHNQRSKRMNQHDEL